MANTKIANLKGPTGAAGAQGNTGATGATGSPGAAATIAVGTTTTGAAGSNASVTNSGTSAAAVFNFTVPQGVQGVTGTQGPIGNTGPQGAQGNPGANSWTLTGANFTVPPIGSTVVVTVNDTSWAVVGEFVWVATAGGSANAPMALQITAKAPTTLTLLNPPTAGTAPSGDANNLITVGSDSLLYLPPSALDPEIWNVRLRSYNAIGNPTFEVDQRNVGNSVSNAPTSTFIGDRWRFSKSAGATFQVSTVANQSGGSGLVVPGTNFRISHSFCSVTLTTAQATLAATDYMQIFQVIEGPLLRELINDVTSISLLVYTSVAGLKFTVNLQDGGSGASAYMFPHLFTVPTANTWTLLTLPNISVWPSGGTFSLTPGNLGYYFEISLAAGSNYIGTPDVWQTGNTTPPFGVSGMSNFAASPVNSQFFVGFVQHEPGALCTTLIDKPWQQNYDECLRYYNKTYDYGTAVGAVTSAGIVGVYAASATSLQNIGNRFKKPMARTPTVTPYNHNTGAANSALDWSATSHAITAVNGTSTENPFYQLISTGLTTGQGVWVHYTADTSW